MYNPAVISYTKTGPVSDITCAVKVAWIWTCVTGTHSNGGMKDQLDPLLSLVVFVYEMTVGLYIRLHPQYGMVLDSDIIWTLKYILLSNASAIMDRRQTGNMTNLVVCLNIEGWYRWNVGAKHKAYLTRKQSSPIIKYNGGGGGSTM